MTLQSRIRVLRLCYTMLLLGLAAFLCSRSWPAGLALVAVHLPKLSTWYAPGFRGRNDLRRPMRRFESDQIAFCYPERWTVRTKELEQGQKITVEDSDSAVFLVLFREGRVDPVQAVDAVFSAHAEKFRLHDIEVVDVLVAGATARGKKANVTRWFWGGLLQVVVAPISHNRFVLVSTMTPFGVPEELPAAIVASLEPREAT